MDYNNQEAPYFDRPNDYKTWSIVNLAVSIFFWCSCTGIISLILSIIAFNKSNDVNKYLQAGESGLVLAQDASKTAKTLNIISSVLLGLGIISSIISIICWGAFGFGDMMRTMQMR